MSTGQPPHDDGPRDPTVLRPRPKPAAAPGASPAPPAPGSLPRNIPADSRNFDATFGDSPRAQTVLRPRAPERAAAPPPPAPPRPAAAPRAPVPPPPRAAAPERAPAPAYAPPPRREPARDMPRAPEPAPAALDSFLQGGSNPLVQSAATLLVLCTAVREAVSPPDTVELRDQIVAAIQQFETQARAANVPSETAVTARYVLCTFIDESIMNTPWGEQSLWSERTALTLFHRDTWGGEKVFQILDRGRKDIGKHRDLVELVYICIALGFAGKYAVENGGDRRLAELQADLYAQLHGDRASEPGLSPHWTGMPDTRGAFTRLIPPWLVAVAALSLLVLVLIGLHLALGRVAAPVEDRLASIGNDLPPLPPDSPPVVAPPDVLTLKRLLSAEEAAGALTVEDYADRSVVRLSGDTFASGSTDPTAATQAALAAVAVALNRLPGRVLVVGHTDDQPIRSLRFASNRALSEARARSAAAALSAGMAAASRVEVSGAGSEQPVATPPSTPENRARNRRVEITLING